MRPAVFAGCLAALVAAGAEAAPGRATAPLSGVLRADGAPLVGVSLVVRGLTGAAASVVRVLKTDGEGTFCLADASPGVYSVLAAVPGFRSATAQVLHRASGESLSFVRLDLDRDRPGVLPAGPGGALDPWTARAVLGGDVLRDEAPVGAPTPASGSARASAASVSASAAVPLPLRGTVRSLQGFGAEGSESLSQTALDVRGSLGKDATWGLSGEFDRLTAAGGEQLGRTSRVALDVLPARGHSIHVSSRRSELPSFDSPDARLDAHSVDWAAEPGRGSRASVSARLVSHRNLEPTLPTPLFQGEGRALAVDARYRSEVGEGRFVRLYVGYRSDLGDSTVALAARSGQEARVGGAAGVRLLDALLVEAGGTGDYSDSSRGLTPEITVSLEALAGVTVYGFASRRFEQRDPNAPLYGLVGIDAADLVRATRSHYRAGTRLESGDGTTRLELEASRREISDAFQLLLDSELIDRVDALYLFPGDVSDEASGSFSFVLGPGLAARLAVTAGRARGEGDVPGALRNHARYQVSSARIDVLPSGTAVSVRYRLLEQELGQAAAYRNGRESVDVTVAQEIPIPVLRALGSRWQALFSVALENRREGDSPVRPNRQMSGGLSLTF
ncbi:MAG: carboxypeptidase-like regulatory domain-containing protein [Thermoanaerobaculia bacterium]